MKIIAFVAAFATLTAAAPAHAQFFHNYNAGNSGSLIGLQTGGILSGNGVALGNNSAILSGNSVGNGILSGILNRNGLGLNLFSNNERNERNDRNGNKGKRRW